MNGLLLVDKPAGWTSHDVVAKLRKIIQTRRIGHAGTLDPFATGLLLLGIGKGTKKLHALLGTEKTYRAQLVLGATSTTFDPEGIITPTDPLPPAPSVESIENALNQFRGGYDQRAPLFSAKKRDGVPLYRLARRGKAAEEMRPIKHVIISELIVEDYHWPFLDLQIRCGSGTYIRSLADDIGEVLGTGAYVTALRRTKIDHFSLIQAISWDPIPSREEIKQALIPVEENPDNLLDTAEKSC